MLPKHKLVKTKANPSRDVGDQFVRRKCDMFNSRAHLLSRLLLFNSRRQPINGYYLGALLFTIQRIWIVLGRCLFLWSVHRFSKSNSSGNFGHAETGSRDKKRVRKRYLNKSSLSRWWFLSFSLWFLLFFSIFWIEFFSRWFSQSIHSSF